ncbi:MAG: DUF2267 domain-containing protein [Ferruginibacter sp.]
MGLDFENYAVKANEFVRLVAEELNIPVKNAGSIVRAVFHALRNRLSHEESFHLMAQLPMPLKGVYADNWKFNKDYINLTELNDFIGEVITEDQLMSHYDFNDPLKARKAIAAVFKALNYIISEAEMSDILQVLPSGLNQFVNESIDGRKTML